MDSIRLKNKYFDTTGIYDSAIGKTQNEVNYSKVDKVNGMGLSSNDYSFSEKEKVSNIKNMAYLDYVVTGEGYKFTENSWIRTEGDSVNVTAMESHTGFCCIAIPCVGGDKFTITGVGSTTTHRLWVFVKADGTYLPSNNAYCSGSNASEKNKVITAPSDAVYLVMNASMTNEDYPPSLYDGAVNQSATSSSLPTYSDIASSFTNGGLASGTYSFSFSVPRENISPVEYNIESKYAGDSRPYIVARLYDEAGTLMVTGQKCNVGRTNQFIRQTFRIPNNEMVRKINFSIKVPEGSTLYINNFNVNYNPCVKPYYCGIEVTAHEGYDDLYPHGSYRSIVAAADLGFNSCIVIPKFTSDNTPVCFHDDSNIGGDFKNEDGTAISSLTSASKISDFTYNQLMQWSIGYTNSRNIYPEQKILLMDDFLRICAKTGMRPVFSIHPAPTLEQWGILKDLLDKYNLTKYCSVKSGNYISSSNNNPSVWKNVITTFGDENIYSIIFLLGKGTTYQTNMATLIANGRQDSGAVNTKISVEFYDSDISSNARSQEMMQEAMDAGYEVSIILENNASTDKMEHYLDIGVTKFAILKNGFCSNGLNW